MLEQRGNNIRNTVHYFEVRRIFKVVGSACAENRATVQDVKARRKMKNRVHFKERAFNAFNNFNQMSPIFGTCLVLITKQLFCEFQCGPNFQFFCDG